MKKELLVFLLFLTFISCSKWEKEHSITKDFNEFAGIWHVDSMILFTNTLDSIGGFKARLFKFDSTENYTIVISETLNVKNKKAIGYTNLFNQESQFEVDIVEGLSMSLETTHQLRFSACEGCRTSSFFLNELEGEQAVYSHIRDSFLFIGTNIYTPTRTQINNFFLSKRK